MSDELTGGDLSAQLLRGLRVAQCVIALVILTGLSLPTLVAGWWHYHPGWVGFAGWGVLVALSLVDVGLVVRHRFWGRARYPVAVGVLALAIALPIALDPSEVSGPAHFTLGVAGWIWVLLFADGRMAELGAFLLAHLLAVLALLIAVGRGDQVTLVSFATSATAVTAFQVAVGLAASALRSVARSATEAAEQAARARTEEDVARLVHTDREARYAELRAVASPLLTGVGDGSLRPADPAVQLAAAGAAARLRRMFAGAGEEALAVELAALIDIAERRGIVVRYSERPYPVPPPDAVRTLLAAVGAALHATRREARVTLAGAGGVTVIGVVTDGTPLLPVISLPDVGITVTEEDGTTWVEARWTPPA